MSSPKFAKIAVPVDFSELSDGALALAEQIAERSGGELAVLYADPFLPPPHFTSSQIEKIAQDLEESRGLASDELERHVAGLLTRGVRYRTSVIENLPVPAIVDWARDNAPDLIVMGTHGRSGLNRFMLGSVTERVLRETPVPLLTVRSASTSPRSIRKILCPVNFTGSAQKALEHAAVLARLMQAELTVVHVSDGDAEGEDALSSLEGCIRPIENSPAIQRVTLRGVPDETVLRYAEENGTDLIVLAATHRRFLDTTVLGSTTVHVIRHSAVPVLTVTSRPE